MKEQPQIRTVSRRSFLKYNGEAKAEGHKRRKRRSRSWSANHCPPLRDIIAEEREALWHGLEKHASPVMSSTFMCTLSVSCIVMADLVSEVHFCSLSALTHYSGVFVD